VATARRSGIVGAGVHLRRTRVDQPMGVLAENLKDIVTIGARAPVGLPRLIAGRRHFRRFAARRAPLVQPFAAIPFIKSVHVLLFIVMTVALAVFLYEVIVDRITFLTWVTVGEVQCCFSRSG
jgi:hypothetical protein